MDDQGLIIIVVSLLAVFSLICALSCFRLFKSWREAADQYHEQALRLEREMKVLYCNMEAASNREGDMLRRIAWLESRVRLGKKRKDDEDSLVQTRPVQNRKPTITERRHRVLALAHRGQKAESIASTLGLPHGEVELIINLDTIS
jgi:hypothetical protein